MHQKKGLSPDEAFYAVWKKYMESNTKDGNNQYGSKEEERNITDIEQYTAQKFGLGEGKVTRTTHGGRVYDKTKVQTQTNAIK